MSKLTNLTFPTFAGAKTFGQLQQFRGPWALAPYNNTYHPPLCDPKAWEDAKTWFPFKQRTDILLTSYPKCGHHLSKKMCLEILKANHNGKYTADLYKTSDMGFNTTPFIEYYVSQTPKQDILQRIKLTDNIYPRLWFTHHSFDNIPMTEISKQHKIITMIRNPKDCIISSLIFFNYASKSRPDVVDASNEFDVDAMLSYFLRGINVYGCYFKYYETYWNALINDNYNILWLYYEDCIENPLQNIKKIANFIFDGKDRKNEPFKVLNISHDAYSDIVDKMSIDSVRKDVMCNPQTFELGSSQQFFRKGINNDWKNYFNQYQSQLVDETMYFKWAQHGNDIKYYKEVMRDFNDKYNKNYFVS